MTSRIIFSTGVRLFELEQFEYDKISGMPFDRQSAAPTFLVEIVDIFSNVFLVATILLYLFPIYSKHKSNDNNDDRDKKVGWCINKLIDND